MLFRLPERPVYFWIQVGISALCLAGAYYIYVLKSGRKPFFDKAVLLTAAASLVGAGTLIIYGAYSLSSANEYIDTVING